MTIRILVTGAGGFIGHHLVKRLKAEGNWVRGADIKLPEYEPWMTGTLVYAEPFWRHDLVGLRDPSA